jgi:hypothetical protein
LTFESLKVKAQAAIVREIGILGNLHLFLWFSTVPALNYLEMCMFLGKRETNKLFRT